MADDSGKQRDKDKAEKLAAARKRFEELKKKKQPSKKANAASSSSTSIVPTTEHTSETASSADTANEDSSNFKTPANTANRDELVATSSTLNPDHSAEEGIGKTEGQGEGTVAETQSGPKIDASITSSSPSSVRPRGLSGAGHIRRPSLTAAEVLRSSDLYSPIGEISPEASLPEIYRKQVSTINDLQAEKQSLVDSITELQAQCQKAAETMVERDKALEDLAAVSDELKLLKEKQRLREAEVHKDGADTEKLKAEVVSLNRQISHMNSQIMLKDKSLVDLRRATRSASPSNAEVSMKSKEEQIENMSIEISSLRTSLEKITVAEDLSSKKTLVLQTQLELLAEESKKAESAADELKRKLKIATDRLVAEAANKSSYDTKLKSMETTLVETHIQMTNLERDTKQLQETHASMKKLQANSDIQLADSNKRLVHLQRENTGLQSRLVDLKGQIQNLSTENIKLKDDIHKDKLRSGLSQLDEDEIDNLEDEERDRLKQRLKILEEHLYGTDTNVRRSNQPDQIAPAITASDETNVFSDVDLQSTSERTQASLLGGVGAVSDLFSRARGRTDSTSAVLKYHEDQQRQKYLEQAKRELSKWKGFRLDLTANGGGYETSYNEVFEV